ncbi:MAG: sigma-54 dependent transcriptional regulator [Planctomycetes bacterium]|nr:sigma-54 dependent transcriptional regulator [Planctomycetota bacterium]
MSRILLIDDDPDIRGFLRDALAGNGHHVDCLDRADRGPEVLSQADYDVVLLDNKLPGISGIEFLAALEERDVRTPVILMTGDPTSDTAMQAMNLGAFDYVVKPLEIDDLAAELAPLIAEAAEIVHGIREPVRLPGDDEPGEGAKLLGNSRPMQEVYKLIGKVAASDVPVLILGETGTGKELAARAIHSYSRRKTRPFVAMNCTALTENLLDDELFGHEPRAYTGAGDKLRKGRFEHAHGGTLFLDEVGDMPVVLQAKLLRVLENREIVRIGGNEPIPVDVRIVSATHRDLAARSGEGQFREDLLFRLKGVTISLPPLRERGRDDLQLLVEHFLRSAAKSLGRTAPPMHPTALKKLAAHSWPGNIRELQHVIRLAVVTCRGSQIAASDIEFDAATAGGGDAAAAPSESDVGAHIAQGVRAALAANETNLYHRLHDIWERELIRQTLAACGGNQVQTARRLGISRNGLRAKMQAHGLE